MRNNCVDTNTSDTAEGEMSAKRAHASSAAADKKLAAIDRQMRKLAADDPNKPDTAWNRAGGVRVHL